MSKTVKLEDIYPLIAEQLENGGSASFTIHGTSMLPMLLHGIDSVRIEKAVFPLRKYDIPFYRRADGAFVLHRIVGVKDDGYVCRGDNQLINEYKVTDNMIIGITRAYTHRGKPFEMSCIRQLIYSRIRVNTHFIRLTLHRVCLLARRVTGRIKRK